MESLVLKQLELLSFKNIQEISLSFSSKINCFTGLNGAGKTNLLDAIYYLSFCKSFFSSSDHDNIRHGDPMFLIQGFYVRNESQEHISCSVRVHEKKEFRRNRKEYARFSDHIGLFPLVIVSPYDANLITDGSEERRKFVNGVISQYDKQYLNDTIQYNRFLKQRNALLKTTDRNQRPDMDTLMIYNEKLVETGTRIFEKRNEFTEKINPVFASYYNNLSDGKEKVGLLYKSPLHEGDFGELLNQSIETDLRAQYTTVGIHKDDLMFTMQDYPVRTNGSQGQQKSFLLSLKLAQFDFIKEQNTHTPLLLLDDIFDKLDEHRVSRLLDLVAKQHFGQIFITDTDRHRVESLVSRTGSEFSVIELDRGNHL